MGTGKAAWPLTGLVLLVGGCGGGDTMAPRQLSVVAIGRVADATGTPIKGAFVAIQTLWPGQAGTRLGCTGSYTIGEWSIRTADDGEFGVDLRLNPPSTRVCVVVYGTAPGDSVWRDTAAVLTNLRVVDDGVQPDTARFDLKLAK